MFQPLLLSAIVTLILQTCLHAQGDNFDDGTDAEWTHLDLLQEAGAGAIASVEVVSQQYHLASALSPAPPEAGPSRVASMRQDVIYQDAFFISVDIVEFDVSLQQAIGVLAMIQPNPGLGAIDGYSLSFQPLTGDVVLNRVTGEQPTELARFDFPVDPASLPFRLVFFGKDGNLEGRLYKLNDLTTPLAVVQINDSTYTGGTCGLFLFDDTDDASGSTDATFDNYQANALTFPVLQISKAPDKRIQIRWPDWAVHFKLQQSQSLTPGSWSTVPAIMRDESLFIYEDDIQVDGSHFFRLVPE